MLFDDKLRFKLDHPDMSLDQWMSHMNEKRVKFKVEKVQTGKSVMTGKRYGYKITVEDPLWAGCVPAIRTRTDFHLLQFQLEKRFPNSVVPKVFKKEVDNLHLMELYLTEMSLNPFFRMDVAFSDFMNGKQKDYKQTKKNDRKHSQGTLRWLQQQTEYRDVPMEEVNIKSYKSDLDQLKRATNQLIVGIAAQIRTMGELQSSVANVTASLGDFLAVEQASENKVHGSVAGRPSGKVKGLITKLINLHTDHQNGLAQSYDGGSLERLTVHHLTLFIREINGFKRVIDVVTSAKSDYDRAKSNFDGIPNESPSKETSRQTLAQKDIVFFKQKRALGFELEKFQTFKTIKIERIYNNLVKFHLRGANRITQEWTKAGLRLNPQEEQQFMQEDSVYASQEANPVGRSRAKSINGTTKRTKALELKSLEVLQGFVPSMLQGKYLKISKGELLTGTQIENGDWDAKNNKGKSGIVKASHVQIAKQQGGYVKGAPAPGPAPGLPEISFGGMIDADDGEWSVSGDSDNGGGGFGAVNAPSRRPQQPSYQPPQQSYQQPPQQSYQQPQQQMPTPPTMSAMPPGLGGGSVRNAQPPSNPPPSNTGGGFPSFGGPPQNSGFQAPPSNNNSGGFGMPGGGQPQNNFNSSASGGMGMPGAQPSNPAFGGPRPPAAAPQPAQNKPKGGMFGGGKSSRNKPKAKANKTKPKFGGGGGKKFGGGPGGGAGGPPKLNFLADISKGNNMKKLTKVPDGEKSKEIGGGKGLSAADKAKGKKAAPTGGGGGGLMGEMAAAMNRRDRKSVV